MVRYYGNNQQGYDKNFINNTVQNSRVYQGSASSRQDPNGRPTSFQDFRPSYIGDRRIKKVGDKINGLYQRGLNKPRSKFMSKLKVKQTQVDHTPFNQRNKQQQQQKKETFMQQISSQLGKFESPNPQQLEKNLKSYIPNNVQNFVNVRDVKPKVTNEDISQIPQSTQGRIQINARSQVNQQHQQGGAGQLPQSSYQKQSGSGGGGGAANLY